MNEAQANLLYAVVMAYAPLNIMHRIYLLDALLSALPDGMTKAKVAQRLNALEREQAESTAAQRDLPLTFERKGIRA